MTNPHPLNDMHVDHIGSLLRPAALKSAFMAYARQEISRIQLEQAQDQAINKIIADQEKAGLPVVSDGEYRRLNWQVSFSDVEGWDLWKGAWDAFRLSPDMVMEGEQPLTKGADAVVAHRAPATTTLSLKENFPLREYGYASSVAKVPVKAMLMGPDRVAQMCDLDDPASAYQDADAFLSDVVKIQHQMVTELVEAGCPYVQIDEPSYTGYVDPPTLERLAARGENPMANLDRAIAADNAIIDGLEDKALFALHICRGNRASMWHREGTYDGIAERLFNGLNYHRLLLEYDSKRAGSFEPLRFVPKGPVVVLGLITTKSGAVETTDELIRRIEDAARYIPVEQIALSPQCGFASGIGGNFLSEDEQWQKLDVMMAVADKVWGH